MRGLGNKKVGLVLGLGGDSRRGGFECEIAFTSLRTGTGAKWKSKVWPMP